MSVKFTQGFVDRSREFSATQWYVAESAADNYAGSIVDAQAVQAAIAAVTLCNFTNLSLSVLVETDTPVTPADDYAQREIALWVQYVDTVTGKYYSMQIPGPDLSLLAQANTDEVDIAANVTAAALVAVLEQDLVSEADNPIEVTRMRIIGRRS